MIRYIIIVSLLLFTKETWSQNPFFPTDKSLKRTLIIKDSTGKVYSDKEWMKLTTGYKYKFQKIDSTATTLTYLLLAMSDAERMQALANIPQEETRIFKTGEKILAFSFKDLEGNKFTQKSLKGKIIVLVFLFLQSNPTKYQAAELNELVTKYKQRDDIVFIAVVNETAKSAKTFVEETGFQFHISPDAGFVMKQYGIYSWPTHVVLDKEGKVFMHNVTYRPGLTNFWIDKSIIEISSGINPN